MILYRIEDDSGIGIYQSQNHEYIQKKTVSFNKSLNGLKEENYTEDQIESFYEISLNGLWPFMEDFMVKIFKNKLKPKDMFSAFISAEQMFNWFDPISLIELDNKLFVSVYESSRYFYNHSQAIFLKKESKFLTKENLSNFLERNI